MKNKYTWLIAILSAAIVIALAAIVIILILPSSTEKTEPRTTIMPDPANVQEAESDTSVKMPDTSDLQSMEEHSLPSATEPVSATEAETASEPLSEPEPEPEPDPHLTAVAEQMDLLQNELSEEVAAFESKWAVYVEDIDTGYSICAEQGVSCDDSMVSASIVKMFVMACFYQKFYEGEFSEDELYSDIYQMITISDNEATNRLIRVLGYGDVEVGLAEVGTYAASIGCTQTSMHRLMLEENGMQNYVSAVDCAKLLRMIYEGSCVTSAYSEKMLAILKDQYWHDLLPKGLPEGTVCAHKSGALLGLSYGDVGIVYNDAGPYIVCIICNDPVSDGACTDEIGVISGIIDSAMSLRPRSDADQTEER